MNKLRQRKLTFALAAMLLIFAACKSETPTTPSLGTGGTPSGGGGITPPTNATIVLSASNTSPVVNSNVIITATVTQNNQPVPNGTAVQFTVNNNATFTDTGAVSNNGISTVIKTTINGAATATLTSSIAGAAIVTATVNNVSKQITITFGTSGTTTPPSSTTPTITAVTPATGKPQGGDVLNITGTNFISPVRVLFDLGGGVIKEGFVCATCVSPTLIQVVSPAIDLAPGTSKAADVIVITQAGTANEQRVVKSGGFTFASANLTSVPTGLQPTSGPIGGGTRITILGSGFQTPMQVFFGAAEAQIISVQFSQIIVMSPKASDTSDNASGVVTGHVEVTLKSLNTGTSVTVPGGFRYVPKMQITTVGPTSGPFTGGTQITIDGSGFDDPLSVVIAVGASGVAAQVIKVSGTEVVAITPGIQPSGCGDQSGAITVTNTENGDQATGPQFTFKVPKPVILSVNPSTVPIGGTTNIRVLGAFGFARITIGGVAVTINSQTDNGDGTVTFNVTVPATVQLSTVGCPAGGTAPTPTAFDVVYTSATTGCTDTLARGVTVTPAAVAVFGTNPLTFTSFTASITPNVAPAPPFPGTSVSPSSPQTLQLINNGTAPLTIQSVTTAGPGCGQFVFGPAVPPVVTLAQCEAIPVTVTFLGQTSPGTQTCTLTVTTSAGSKNFLLVGTSQ